MTNLIPISSLLIFLSFGMSHAQELSTKQTAIEQMSELKRSAYQERLKQLEKYRIEKLKVYQNSNSAKKQVLIEQLKTKLVTELTEQLFPAWYGTTWDYNGTSNKPGEGKIACGYFVSTTLKHLGFKVNRFKLAQQPSQNIIKTFVPRSDIDISSKRSLANIKKQLIKSGDGLYIVGLDTHVGYISVKDTTITFIHSSYYGPKQEVKAEPYDSKNPLADSKYRVFGKLFNDEMVINWLKQKQYSVAQ